MCLLPATTQGSEQKADDEDEQSSEEKQQDKPVVQDEVEGNIQPEETWSTKGMEIGIKYLQIIISPAFMTW